MVESRTTQSVKNIVTGFGYQFIVIILQFVVRTVFVKILGEEYLGLNGIFSDVLALLSLADLGFGTAMAYSFYKPLVDNDQNKIATLIGFYNKIYNIVACIVAVVGILCLPFLKYIVNTEEEVANLNVLYLISLVNVVISYLFVYKTTLLSAAQKNYKLNLVNITTTFLKSGLQIALLLIFKNYILYLIIGVIIQLVNNIIATKITEKEFPYIRDKSLKKVVDFETRQSIFENLKSVFLYKISVTMFTATDNILISIIVGTAMVGIYSNYLMVSSKLLLLIQVIFSSVTAGIGNVIAKESDEKKYEIFQATQSVSFILSGIIVSVFCLMANDFVHVWLGAEFEVSRATIYAITLNTYLGCVLQPLWSYRDAAGLYIKTKYVMLIGAVINIVLSVCLGNMWGLFGIIISSAIARLSSYFWYEPKILFQDYFNRKPGRYYISLLLNLFIVVACIAALSFVTKDIVVNNWFMLILKGIIIGIVCLLVFVVVYRKSDGYLLIKGKLVRKIKG